MCARVSRLLVLICGVLVSIGCRRGHENAPAAPPLALKVANHAFTESDVRTMESILRWKYGDRPDLRDAALAYLAEHYLLVEMLAAMGHPLTDAQVDAEIERIDRESRAPELLRELKEICGRKEDVRYRRLAVIPPLANRRYYFELYPSDPGIHAARLDEATRLLAGLPDSADLESVSKANPTWRFERLAYSPKRGFRPLDLPKQADDVNFMPEEEYEREVFSTLRPGEIFRKVVSLPQGFAAIRWTGWEGEERIVERLVLSKKDAQEHFVSFARTAPMRTPDPELTRKVWKMALKEAR